MPKANPAANAAAAGKKTRAQHLKEIKQAHSRCLELQQDALKHGQDRNRLIAEAARSPQWNNREVEYLLELSRIQTGVDLLACKRERNALLLPSDIQPNERLQLVLSQHQAYTDVLTKLVKANQARKEAEAAAERAVSDRAMAIKAAHNDGVSMEQIATTLKVAVQRAEKMTRQGTRNRYESETNTPPHPTHHPVG